MVQMAIVKVVHMAVVPNRGVPAVWAMPMGVVGMVLLSASGHDFSLSQPRFGNSTRCPSDRTRPAAPAKCVMNCEIMQGFDSIEPVLHRRFLQQRRFRRHQAVRHVAGGIAFRNIRSAS
jgi:hypothetical protein